ncbi:MAG TPA: MarC family protein [Puia sp.]|uniref:MarC family protein n=1 Tax=Puia sp. TaxID=2045100 RepID=UPI002C463156|nr:MarC family protein [Puia sp.]HVU97449.1 MarC family protein [Puia sp.]
MRFDLPFLHTVFIGFLSLFPAVNPVGSAFIIDPLLGDLTFPERKRAAKRIALYCFAICIVSALIGSWIMRLFGISIPIVQLAGGVLICRMGWQLLNTDQVKGEKETAQPVRRPGDIDSLLFYPISFPMSTGAGTISVILTLATHEDETDILNHVLSLAALFVAILVICVLIYICYANTARLIQRLGPRGEQIVNRLSAFLVFCIGMQIAWGGIRTLFKL